MKFKETDMTTNIIKLISVHIVMILMISNSSIAQLDTSTISYDAKKIGKSFDKKNIKPELKDQLCALFKADVVFFKRKNYGSVFNQPTRNVLLAFEYDNGFIVYYKYVALQSQNRVLCFNNELDLIAQATYCGFILPKSPTDLIEMLNRCGRLIQQI